MSAKILALAARLDEARRGGDAVPQLSDDQRLDLDEAYAVQHAGIALRTQRGETMVGAKLGFTSRAKAEQMGVADVIVGVLTSGMVVENGGTLDLARGVHPRVEPEVAFRLGSAIDVGNSSADLLGAVVEVAPALEVIDSRYRDFKFSLTDVVADNTSASHFAIGEWVPVEIVREALDLAAANVDMTFDGQVVASGSTADILGDPLNAISAIARMASLHGHSLPAGAIILAGAATAAVALRPGVVVEATVLGLGSVTLHVSRGEADD